MLRDYHLTRELLVAPMARSIGGMVSDGAEKRLLLRLRTCITGRRQAGSRLQTRLCTARKNFPVTGRSAAGSWNSLHAGMICVVTEGGRGRPYAYVLSAMPGTDDELEALLFQRDMLLPSVEQLKLGDAASASPIDANHDDGVS